MSDMDESMDDKCPKVATQEMDKFSNMDEVMTCFPYFKFDHPSNELKEIVIINIMFPSWTVMVSLSPSRLFIAFIRQPNFKKFIFFQRDSFRSEFHQTKLVDEMAVFFNVSR